MLRIKKVDLYIIKNFIIVFFAVFFICLFVFIMQFLWMNVDDLVGKGISISLLSEFFFYSSLTLVPMSLPLAILLASLMTFGSFGEKLELLALKSAGISLFRIMAPLLFLVVFFSAGAFYFSNNVLPMAQQKLWTLMFSLRHKSPELEIPTGEFYSQINGLNIYVRSKDHKRKLLNNVMIYDFSNGFNNATVMTADSARLFSTEDKKNLVLILYDGESFENLKKQTLSDKGNVPYRRETFKKKEILIDFDSNFNRMDESLLQGQHVSKNIVRLGKDIDSARIVQDSLINTYSQKIETKTYLKNIDRELVVDSSLFRNNATYDHDTLFYKLSKNKMERAVKKAINSTEIFLNETKYNNSIISDNQRFITRHSVEWYKKFTLSFACIIFFFIGSPLGAIIRKGGLGAPVVISVILFIIYYIIDNMGKKMATEGIWDVWFGMWFSSIVLLPLGIFLTYKAANDSELFNSENWILRIKKLKQKLNYLSHGKFFNYRRCHKRL